MANLVDDLSHSAKFLDDAHHSTKNAVTLLDRLSPRLTEEALEAMQILEDLADRTRSAAKKLESI